MLFNVVTFVCHAKCCSIFQNMFTTLKYLCVVGGITFVGGNNMLSAIAARRESGYVCSFGFKFFSLLKS